MRVIITTNGYRVTVNNHDYRSFGHLNWRGLKARNGRVYVVRRCGAALHYLHRRIMRVTDSHLDVDHKDRNGLNCRRINLRICTRSQNNGNSKKQERKTSSRFKGVNWFKPARLWRAYVKGKSLGYFHNEIKAAKAYDREAVVLWGEFARTNFKVCK